MSRTKPAECAGVVKSITKLWRRLVTRPIENDPLPRESSVAPTPIVWPIRRNIKGWFPRPIPPRGFAEVLAARRSWRSLNEPTLLDVLDAVSAATLVQSNLVGDPFERSRRAVASAGALHPISVVVMRPALWPLPLRVDPWSGRLQALKVADGAALRRGIELLVSMVPNGNPTFAALLGDIALVDGAYANPGSLLWRDAGALLATLHLCASAIGLGFCPLGLLGNEIAAALFPGNDRIVACGTAAIGVVNATLEPER